MTDRHDELIRRAAELMAESKQLKAVSEGLAGLLAKRREAGSRAMGQPGERQPAPAAAGPRGSCPAGAGPERGPVLPLPGAGRGAGVPGGDRTGEVSVTRPGPWPGTGILDEDEAVTLAVLLEELAARPGPDPLSGLALQAAALLRRRVAAGPGRGVRPRWGDPAARRESGDTRDGAADHRDAQAAQRDTSAVERDDRATERDRQAVAAAQKAAASEQRMRHRLRAADLRDHDAAAPPPASGDAERQPWQLDPDGAGPDQARAGDEREAIGELLAQAGAARHAALQDRYAAGQDRAAARRDRGGAHADRQDSARDRHAARADRDQAVIESEEDPPPRN